MVLGERRDVRLQALAGAQPGQQLARDPRALAIVADERDVALGRVVARRGLAGVVQQRAEAQRAAARELVGERLGQERCDRLAVARPERRRRDRARSRSSPPAPQACGRGRRGGESGSARSRAARRARAGHARSARASPSARGPSIARSLVMTCLSSPKTRSCATSVIRLARCVGRRDRRRVGLETQPGRKARQPQHPQRIAVEGLRGHHPHAAALEVAPRRRRGPAAARRPAARRSR